MSAENCCRQALLQSNANSHLAFSRIVCMVYVHAHFVYSMHAIISYLMDECINHPEPALDYDKIPAPVVQTIIVERVKDRDVFLSPRSPFGGAVTTTLPTHRRSVAAIVASSQEGLSNSGHCHSGSNDHLFGWRRLRVKGNVQPVDSLHAKSAPGVTEERKEISQKRPVCASRPDALHGCHD